MGAPKGNRNGASAWQKPISDEKTFQLSVRVPLSVVEMVDQQLQPGQIRSDWLREAIALKLGKSF